jgi:hypothetical protein
MKVVVAHHSTEQAVVKTVDQASDKLFSGGIKNIQIVDQKRTWNGPVMSFCLTAKLGFISVPLAGTMAVDETNVTLECEVPPLVKHLMGEERFRAMMEENVQGLLR